MEDEDAAGAQENDEEDGQGGEEAGQRLSFSCRLDSAKAVTTLLSCLSDGRRKDQRAKCRVNPDELTFIVTGRAMTTQCSGTLHKDLFQSFDSDEDASFGINLTTLLECLQVFGPNTLAQTSVVMSYKPDTAIFDLQLQETGVTTTCDIRTMHESEDEAESNALSEAYRAYSEECQITMRSEYLKEPLQELADFPGAASITLNVSQRAPYFQFSVAGSMGTSKIDFPKTSEAFVNFKCDVPKLSWTYLLTAFEGGMRALSSARETYFCINTQGMLSVQHQLPSLHGNCTYIDFIISPDQPDEGEEREEEDDVLAHGLRDPHGIGNGRDRDDGGGGGGGRGRGQQAEPGSPL